MATKHCVSLGPLERATFLRRPNRFLGWVQLDGEERKAHVPDPGRLTELLFTGAEVYVRRHAPDSGKSTACQVVLARGSDSLVSIDTQVPNRLVRMALEAGEMPELGPYINVRPEFARGRSRFDFALERAGSSRTLVEVKSVSWRKGDTGWFPDAKTTRGARHVTELTHIKRDGIPTAILFVAQRGDIEAVSPDPVVDPDFTNALRAAAEAGVVILAWRSVVREDSIALDRRVPIRIPPSPDTVS